MLVVAAVVLLIASLRNLGEPWEQGMRGGAAAAYSDGAVAHTLAYGLGATLGMPTFIVEHDGEIERRVNWHHPPLYWLYLSLSAWLFGHHTGVLRVAHLLLFLPGLLALFALMRRRLGPVVAGVVALSFATCPLVAYFGPMVLQDGAVLGLGLVTLWRFQCHVDAPSKRSWFVTAALFFVLTSLDYTGYWWGMAMFGLALGAESRWRAIAWVLS
ncbi:MAG: glycosyltransferase family 39 protein, partial [Planctomycetota bacterium]